MRKYQYYIIATLAFLLILSFFISTQSDASKVSVPIDQNENGLNYKVKRNIKMSESLLNKQLDSITVIIDSLIFIEDEAIILLYSGYDCGSCIESAFTMIKSLNKPKNLYVVGLMTSTFDYEKMYDYREYVYQDEDDILRKELKYVPTPIMLIIDSSYKIKDAIVIDTFNSFDQNKFILRNLK